MDNPTCVFPSSSFPCSLPSSASLSPCSLPSSTSLSPCSLLSSFLSPCSLLSSFLFPCSLLPPSCLPSSPSLSLAPFYIPPLSSFPPFLSLLLPQNRLEESLNLFQAICNNKFFVKTSMVRASVHTGLFIANVSNLGCLILSLISS